MKKLSPTAAPSKLYAKVQSIIEVQLGMDSALITPNAKFIEDLGCDSIDVVELVMAIEEEFDIQISDEAIDNLPTVQSMVDYLQRAKVTVRGTL